MDKSKNPGWKLDSCLGGEWQRMAKGSRSHLERHTVSSWLELWQVVGYWRESIEPCSKKNYCRSEYANTLVTELDLVCDYAQWPHISTSLFYVGSLLGNIIFGNIADRLKKLHILIKCKIEIQIWSANGLLPPPVHGNQPRRCHRFCPKLHRLHHPQASLSVIWGDQ